MADRSVSVRLRMEISSFERGARKAAADTRSLARDMTDAGAAAHEMRRRLEAAVRALPKVKIDADSTAAEVKLASLTRDLEDLASKQIGVDVDTGAALAQIRQVEMELFHLAAFEADPQVKADTTDALVELNQVERQLDRLDGRTARVDVDSAAALASLGKLTDAAGDLGGELTDSVSVLGDVGPGQVAILAGAIQALPAVASVAASGIVFSLGSALLTVGLTGAAQSDRVKRAWSEAVGVIKDELADAATPLEGSAIRAAGVAERTFLRLKPTLSRIFADLVPDVDRFVNLVGEGIVRLGPSLEKLSGAFGSMLGELGNRMPAIMDNLGKAFETFAKIVDEDPQMLANVLEDATELLAVGADVLSWAEEIRAVLTLPIAPQNAGNLGFKAMFGVDPEQFREDMQGAPPMMAAIREAMGHVVKASHDLGDGAGAAELGVRNLSEAMENFFDPAQKALDAEIRLKEAIEDATRAAKEQKLSEVDRLKGVQDVTMAISEAAKAEQARTGSTKDASAAFLDQMGRLTEWAGSNEAAKGAIDGLAASLGITIGRTKDGTVAVDAFGRAVKILPNGKKVAIDADTAKGKAQLAEFLLFVARQKGTVDVFVRTIYDSPSGRRAVEQKTRAAGGIYSADGNTRYMAAGGVIGGLSKPPPPPMVRAQPTLIEASQTVFGEAGKEAFIPYAARYRDRAIDILGTVAQDFGLTVYNADAMDQVKTLSTGLQVTDRSISASLADATRMLDGTLGSAGALTQQLGRVGDIGSDMSGVWQAGAATVADSLVGVSDQVGISTDMIVMSNEKVGAAALTVAEVLDKALAAVMAKAGGTKTSSTSSAKTAKGAAVGSVVKTASKALSMVGGKAQTIDENMIAGHYGSSGFVSTHGGGLSNSSRVSMPQQMTSSASWSAPASAQQAAGGSGSGSGSGGSSGPAVYINEQHIRNEVDAELFATSAAMKVRNRGR